MRTTQPSKTFAGRDVVQVAVTVELNAASIRRTAALMALAALLAACAVASPGAASLQPTVVPATPRSDSSIPGPSRTASVALTLPPDGAALPYPDGCQAYRLSARRCAYIVEWAAGEADLQVDQATIQLLGDPACEGQTTCVATRTTKFVVRVRVISAGGSSTDHPVFCGVGGEASLLCTETPTISVSVPTSGYHDVPCGGEDGNGPCASPVPTVDPDVAPRGSPLVVPRVDVPIDHVGSYVIDLGDAILPNGILSVTSATLSNNKRLDVLVPEGVRLEVLGDDGKPLQNVYVQGWRPGTERVHARLVFTVEEFDPGAVLAFTELVVG
jgi:hypothetical protein